MKTAIFAVLTLTALVVSVFSAAVVLFTGSNTAQVIGAAAAAVLPLTATAFGLSCVRTH